MDLREPGLDAAWSAQKMLPEEGPMLLSQTAEYALRATAFLATLPRGSTLRATDLSRATGIPVSYLSKILRRLVIQGLLTGHKGHGGGFALSRPPARIRLADILKAADFELTPDRCAFGWGQCSLQNPCPLHPIWSRLNDATLAWATRTTLAEVGASPTAPLYASPTPASLKKRGRPPRKR